MAEWFDKAKQFYRSEYPEQVPFKVGVVAIPDTKIKDKHTSAMSLRDVQVVPYILERGVLENLDVIFHEFCHALYDGQPEKVKRDIDDFYLSYNDPHAIFVYRYLNEALATA